jgi:hypothetical protein
MGFVISWAASSVSPDPCPKPNSPPWSERVDLGGIAGHRPSKSHRRGCQHKQVSCERDTWSWVRSFGIGLSAKIKQYRVKGTVTPTATSLELCQMGCLEKPHNPLDENSAWLLTYAMGHTEQLWDNAMGRV